jgi:predicted nucleic acid-binding protein
VKSVVVLDASVVVAGIGWRGGESRSVLHLLAVRGFVSVRTPLVTIEWAESVARVAGCEPRWQNPSWPGWLEWLKRASTLLDDPPAKRIVHRDPDDDVVLQAAIGARADYLVTLDSDLLELERPYGVACVTPRALLSAVLRAS